MPKLIVINRKELQKGIQKEKGEHGMSDAEARKTAIDHLKENPHYYSIADSVGLEDEEALEEALAALNGIPTGKNWPFTKPAGRLKGIEKKVRKAKKQGTTAYAVGPGGSGIVGGAH